MKSNKTYTTLTALALTLMLPGCVQPPTAQTEATTTSAAVVREPPDGAALLQTCRSLTLQDATYTDKRVVGSRVMPSNVNSWQEYSGKPGPYGTMVRVVVAGTDSLGHHVDTYSCEFAGTAMTNMQRLPDEPQSTRRRR